ncbi:MAG: DUF4962 domain-containing protein, partial [Puniceicoccales bacterium]
MCAIFFSFHDSAYGNVRGESNPLQQNWVEIPEPYAEMPLPVNPPTFRWPEGTELPVTLVLTQEGGEEIFVVPDLERYFYRPLEPLQPGEYVWTLLGEGEEIVAGGEFSIDAAITQWPVVASSEAVKNIPSEHPRVHIRPENLEAWQNALEGDENFQTLMRQHGGAYNTPLPDIPAPDPNAPNASKEKFWQSSAYALQMARGVVSSCVLYQITGDQRYLDFVKERALLIADLDPEGLTSHDVNDFGNSRIVNVLGWAYSWTYNDLTEEEREKIRTAIWERCRIALVAAEAEKWPWPYIHTLEYRKIEPHAWQFVNYHLMVGLIAIYGESEESDEWTEWLLDLFVAGYPWFGGEDGGSAEQVPYFLGTNLISSQQAVHLIKTATAIDLTGHPWHRNAPYFMVYGFGTGSNTSQFGDNGGRVPGPRGTMLARNAAVQFQDGVLASYYDALREKASPFHSYIPVLEAPDYVLPERVPLSTLPTSRLFRDVGMVFMRSDIENPDDEIFFEFKSSPYGSTGHGHNDQNSINLSAFGKQLLLDSGFYNYYQSPHHRGYTQTTAAHNTILFNHTGQPHGTSEYWGEIVEFVDTEEFTYAVGDAHRAYNEVDLERFDRHVL